MAWFVLYALIALVVLFIAVILIRTAMFVPKEREKKPLEEINFDKDAAIEALATLVRCKTVSRYNHDEENDAEFEKLTVSLPSLYPKVFEICELKKFDDRGLLFGWKGYIYTNRNCR